MITYSRPALRYFQGTYTLFAAKCTPEHRLGILWKAGSIRRCLCHLGTAVSGKRLCVIGFEVTLTDLRWYNNEAGYSTGFGMFDHRNVRLLELEIALQ